MTNHRRFSSENKSSGDQRISLLRFIKTHHLTGSSKNKVVVVFDGYPEASFSAPEGDFEVLFSRGISADDKIKKILENTANPKIAVVVSDDKEVRFFARAAGAQPLGIEEFIGAKEKKQQKPDEAQETKLSFTQMHKINEELRKLWLR